MDHAEGTRHDARADDVGAQALDDRLVAKGPAHDGSLNLDDDVYLLRAMDALRLKRAQRVDWATPHEPRDSLNARVCHDRRSTRAVAASDADDLGKLHAWADDPTLLARKMDLRAKQSDALPKHTRDDAKAVVDDPWSGLAQHVVDTVASHSPGAGTGASCRKHPGGPRGGSGTGGGDPFRATDVEKAYDDLRTENGEGGEGEMAPVRSDYGNKHPQGSQGLS